MIHSKSFAELTTAELYEILRVRTAVFVVEQQCPYQELDCAADFQGIHLWEDGGTGEIQAYARVYWRDQARRVAQIGRILTMQRGKGLGEHIMHGALATCRAMGARQVVLEAQVYAQGFYEKLGFAVASSQFLEDGIPHELMTLTLND